MTITLKRCPHCGGAAAVDHNYNSYSNCHFFKVKCGICGATGKTTSAQSGEGCKALRAVERAVMAWNMRTPA